MAAGFQSQRPEPQAKLPGPAIVGLPVNGLPDTKILLAQGQFMGPLAGMLPQHLRQRQFR